MFCVVCLLISPLVSDTSFPSLCVCPPCWLSAPPWLFSPVPNHLVYIVCGRVYYRALWRCLSLFGLVYLCMDCLYVYQTQTVKSVYCSYLVSESCDWIHKLYCTPDKLRLTRDWLSVSWWDQSTIWVMNCDVIPWLFLWHHNHVSLEFVQYLFVAN